MNEVYVLEIRCEDGFDSSVILFDSEKSAMYAAMDEIVDIINCMGDPNNSKLKKELDRISSFIMSDDFENALNAYNDLPDTLSVYSHVYVTVTSSSIESQHARKIKLTEEKDGLKPIETQSVQPVASVRKEFSCPHCSRKNDVGVSVCWNCGNSI